MHFPAFITRVSRERLVRGTAREMPTKLAKHFLNRTLALLIRRQKNEVHSGIDHTCAQKLIEIAVAAIEWEHEDSKARHGSISGSCHAKRASNIGR